MDKRTTKQNHFINNSIDLIKVEVHLGSVSKHVYQ